VALTDTGAVDVEATGTRRRDLLAERLAAATPPLVAVRLDEAPPGPVLPLYPGVEQRGAVAVAARSGAPLSVAPAHWTDGCPVLETVHRFDSGPAVVRRMYLDPRTGHSLCVDVVPEGSPRGFETGPRRFTDAR
jgi:N-methylhydantoinase B